MRLPEEPGSSMKISVDHSRVLDKNSGQVPDWCGGKFQQEKCLHMSHKFLKQGEKTHKTYLHNITSGEMLNYRATLKQGFPSCRLGFPEIR